MILKRRPILYDVILHCISGFTRACNKDPGIAYLLIKKYEWNFKGPSRITVLSIN